MQFRKKPVVVEAFCVGSSLSYPQWLHDAISADIVTTFGKGGWDDPFTSCRIKTLEGTMIANEGDWIIRGVKGELYPCKPDIVEATYEPVLEHDEGV